MTATAHTLLPDVRPSESVGLFGMGRESPAVHLLSWGQRIGLLIALAGWVLGAVTSFRACIILTVSMALLAYVAVGLFRARLVHSAWRKASSGSLPAPPALADEDLPTYTVLVPVYREASVIPLLIRHLSRMDYPRERWEVLILCEASDEETIAAVEALTLPRQFRLLVCPEGVPRTKPRACNFGLQHATGELCVIYDAEDRPALDQLRRAADRFHAASPDVICLQARLDYHNRHHNVLARCFTLEYNFWFDLLLPALVDRNLPLPLGGTSNHFKTRALRRLGGWDPYNVTEDADLGVRLYLNGYRTEMLDSVTLEEACAQVRPWIRQRTRWVKGYLQTWAVHVRWARHGRRGGVRGLASLHLLVGGSPTVNLLNPIFWALNIYFAATRASWVLALFPAPLLYVAVLSLAVGNFLFIYVHFLAVVHRERWDLGFAVLLIPIYWLLMSVATWRAVVHLVTKLHRWEKTPHGLSGEQTDPACSGELAALPALTA